MWPHRPWQGELIGVGGVLALPHTQAADWRPPGVAEAELSPAGIEGLSGSTFGPCRVLLTLSWTDWGPGTSLPY